jgi:hypothetical protein
MAFDECGFLIHEIKSRCNDIFGHKETSVVHKKICDLISLDRNDSVEEINKKIELIKQRKDEFYKCGRFRCLYTTHKPSCHMTHLDPDNSRHIAQYKRMYSESEKCEKKLLEFYETIQEELDKYKKNPDPERPDITYKMYVIHLYNKQQKDEEDFRVYLLKDKEKKRKQQELLDIAEQNRKELEEFEKQQKQQQQQLKQQLKQQQQQLKQQELKKKQEELKKQQEELKKQELKEQQELRQQKVDQQLDQKQQKKQQIKDNKYIKDISIEIKKYETNCDFDDKGFLDEFLLEDYIQEFMKETTKNIDDPILFKIICFIFDYKEEFTESSDAFDKIKKHFDKIYENLEDLDKQQLKSIKKKRK